MKTIGAALVLPVLLLLFPVVLGAQETAERYFDSISSYYGSVNDYQGNLTITRGEIVQVAAVSYKNPNMLRLDFSDPEEQVLVVNNEELILYIPAYRVSFRQPLKQYSEAALANMASQQGLDLLKKNYSIGYLVGPEPVPLEEGSPELVTKLKLKWKSSNEGFRELDISIGEDSLIRRIVGITTALDTVQFDFEDIRVNRGIPDSRFNYDSPPEGNTIQNFLFEPEE